MSNKFFAFKDSRAVNICNLDSDSLEKFNFIFSELRFVTSMTIVGGVLDVEYRRRRSRINVIRCNLHTRVRLNNLLLPDLFYRPLVSTSSHLIVHCSLFGGDLDVRRVSGEFLTSLSMDNLIAVVGEFVVYTRSPDTHNIQIWTSRKPDDGPTTLNLGPEECDQTKMISGLLLVLKYQNCFKVVDIEKAKILYTIAFQNFNSEMAPYFCVNQYYYVIIGKGPFEGVSRCWFQIYHKQNYLAVFDFKDIPRSSIL
uniref:CNH domain-containing protein n=1 Tax=Graphocephala atropunctata TaxID=36148 RepID=A0A1B6M7S2_9HEMI